MKNTKSKMRTFTSSDEGFALVILCFIAAVLAGMLIAARSFMDGIAEAFLTIIPIVGIVACAVGIITGVAFMLDKRYGILKKLKHRLYVFFWETEVGLASFMLSGIIMSFFLLVATVKVFENPVAIIVPPALAMVAYAYAVISLRKGEE